MKTTIIFLVILTFVLTTGIECFAQNDATEDDRLTLRPEDLAYNPNENLTNTDSEGSKVYLVDTVSKTVYVYDTVVYNTTVYDNRRNYYYYGDGYDYTYYYYARPVFYSSWFAWSWFSYPSSRSFHQRYRCHYSYDNNCRNINYDNRYYGSRGNNYGQRDHYYGNGGNDNSRYGNNRYGNGGNNSRMQPQQRVQTQQRSQPSRMQQHERVNTQSQRSNDRTYTQPSRSSSPNYSTPSRSGNNRNNSGDSRPSSNGGYNHQKR